MDMYVAPSEGHNDFLMNIALLTEALSSFTAPKDAGYVRPRAMDEGEGRYEQDRAASRMCKWRAGWCKRDAVEFQKGSLSDSLKQLLTFSSQAVL
jgi:hypothetical protein